MLPLFPFALPAATARPRQWYMENYADRFFTEPPAWFTAFITIEAIYHVPLSCWAVTVLGKGMHVDQGSSEPSLDAFDTGH